MDVTLREHGAKHVYRIPEGLRELCSDISREVLRSQPQDIYGYIADYVEALLITRENARVAVRAVKNILLGSEAIVGILNGTGLSLGQIAVAAPRLQKAFRAYLDTVDIQPVRVCEDGSLDEKSRTSVRDILESIGASSDKSEKAATLIQAAFRGHYERMLEREANGDVQLERATKSTTEILKRAGVSRNEAEKAATLIQSAYRGYYTRRNTNPSKVEKKSDEMDLESDLPESRKTIQAVAWLDMMYEDSGMNAQRANDAATLIQSSHSGHKIRSSERSSHDVKTSSSFVVDAIVDIVRHGIIDKVLLRRSRDNIPREFAENEMETEQLIVEKIEKTYKERFRESRLSVKTDNDGIYDNFSGNDEEIVSKDTKFSRESNDNSMKKIRNDDTSEIHFHGDSEHEIDK